MSRISDTSHEKRSASTQPRRCPMSTRLTDAAPSGCVGSSNDATSSRMAACSEQDAFAGEHTHARKRRTRTNT